MYVQCIYSTIAVLVSGHSSLCSRAKLRLRNAAFAMQLSCHVWGSWMKRSPFVCSKSILIKLVYVKTTINFVLFGLLETKFTKLEWLIYMQTCGVDRYVSRFYFFLEYYKSKWRSYIYNAFDARTVTLRNSCKEPVRHAISTKKFLQLKISSQGITMKKIDYLCHTQSKFNCPKIKRIKQLNNLLSN